MVFTEFRLFRISKSKFSEVHFFYSDTDNIIMYFYKQVVDFFLFLYLRSTEAVKKGQIVKDPGISTFKKRARLETFG